MKTTGKEEMKNVLVVATTPLRTDGLTAVLTQMAETAAEQHRISFALGEGATPEIQTKLEKIGNVHQMPSRRGSPAAYFQALSKLAKTGNSADGEFDIVHIHGNSATMAIDLAATRRIPCRISHVHNCAEQPKMKQKTLGKIMNRLVTHPAACSKASGERMYTRPFTVLTNGIDCERFRFRQQIRSEARKQLALESDTLAIGHIGQFNEQKNQARLIRIFREVLKQQSKAKLILCGGGERLEACKSLAEELEKNERTRDTILFVPETQKPEELYAAFDLFVMPSRFEGLPLAGIEAQASGLPCLFSDTITRETQILESCRFIPLTASDREWAEAITETAKTVRPDTRESCADAVIAAGYDLQTTRRQVLELYG